MAGNATGGQGILALGASIVGATPAFAQPACPSAMAGIVVPWPARRGDAIRRAGIKVE